MVLIGLLVLAGAVWFAFYWMHTGRFLETTEDAYVRADTVTIAPKVGGYVEAIMVQDNQMVHKGDPLVRLDQRQYQAVVDKAQADIANLHAQQERLHAQITQLEAQLMQARAQQEVAQLSMQHAASEWERFRPLAKSGASTDEQLARLENVRDQARVQLQANAAAVKAAQGRIGEARAQEVALKAQLAGAQALLRNDRQNVDDTFLRSPLDGKVGDRGVRVGQLVQPGTRLMSIVPVAHPYVVANFKETQIGLMRIGQPVALSVDALPDQTLRGTVESFSPGTGAEFALLPPENATGNFTKIVQRVPVRIRLERAALPVSLIPGMSVRVVVDTRTQERPDA